MNYIQIQTTVVRTHVKTAELAQMKLIRLHAHVRVVILEIGAKRVSQMS